MFWECVAMSKRVVSVSSRAAAVERRLAERSRSNEIRSARKAKAELVARFGVRPEIRGERW